jgi:3',5'-cyclic-nucleotide phosphodiesterase
VRSLSSGWAKSSVIAVDAGVHLSAIAKILEETQPSDLGAPDGPSLPHTLTDGPFAGLEVPYVRADANAAHIHKNLIETYLITHPHLDHIAGFIINTAGLPSTRPKKVAGLPSTISALKTHIFNNVIWPNLSDENNGAGLVTYTRLVEGGSPALGEGEGKGYLEICDGLSVKILGVSHGHCIERHSHRGSMSTRQGSFDASSMGPAASSSAQGILSPSRNPPQVTSAPSNLGLFLHQQQERIWDSRRNSSLSCPPVADESVCVYDSSAYFVRDVASGREVLMFGDVEPDSVSLSPRNRQVWQEAAPKIAAGRLTAIFIECSYDDSQCVERLFGHLTPQFICEEMAALAEEVVTARSAMEEDGKKTVSGHSSGADKKRKRVSHDGALAKRRSTPQPTDLRADIPVSPKTVSSDRRVNSVPSPLSDHGFHLHDLPKTVPLPTHPPTQRP